MTQDNNSQEDRVAKSFEAALNSHGYSFQEAVLNAAQKLAGVGSSWYFAEREFPVEVQGHGTRIDFILRHFDNMVPVFLLAECKRTNPAYSNWGFARTEFISRDRSYEPFIFERLKPSEKDKTGLLQPSQFYITSKKLSDKRIYNIAFDFKSNQPGDPSGASVGRGGAIEEAASQVLRGLNGMAEFLSKHSQSWQQKTNVDAILLPVIFTTSELWTTDIEPRTANIETGKITIPKTSLRQVPWLLHQYHMSPGLKHSLPSINHGDSLSEIMDLEYVRTIPIVSPSGIADFLNWSSNVVIWR